MNFEGNGEFFGKLGFPKFSKFSIFMVVYLIVDMLSPTKVRTSNLCILVICKSLSSLTYFIRQQLYVNIVYTCLFNTVNLSKNFTLQNFGTCSFLLNSFQK